MNGRRYPVRMPAARMVAAAKNEVPGERMCEGSSTVLINVGRQTSLLESCASRSSKRTSGFFTMSRDGFASPDRLGAAPWWHP